MGLMDPDLAENAQIAEYNKVQQHARGSRLVGLLHAP
jgi:hypothetical protein